VLDFGRAARRSKHPYLPSSGRRCGFCIFSLWVLFHGLLLSSTPSIASDWDEIEKDPSGPYAWLGSFGENLRISTDISVRPAIRYSNAPQGDYVSAVGFLGIDLFKVFTSSKGDWGTLIVQPYVTKLNNLKNHPNIFADPHSGKMIYRIVSFNYTGLTRGGLNVRVGHLEIPFGLEHVINTNGTLRDYSHARNFGLKSDWGASLNGHLSGLEYECSATRGTGQSLHAEGSPFLFSGRVGTDRRPNLNFGLSALFGETEGQVGDIERSRLGIDVIYDWRQITVLGEVCAGRTGGDEVFYTMFEFDWNNPAETILLFSQNRLIRMDQNLGPRDEFSTSLGARASVGANLHLSAIWSQSFLNPPGVDSGSLTLQTRLRF